MNSLAISSNDRPSVTGAGFGSMARASQGGAVLFQRLRERSAAMENFGEAPDGREVLRRAREHEFELGLCLVQVIELDECASERDAR